jgi:hypothetical protein
VKRNNETILVRKTLLKYKLLRVRSKISFLALQRRMTVLELFLTTIKACYHHLLEAEAIPPLIRAK